MLPMAATRANPSLLFPLDRTTDGDTLDDLVRQQLAKQGITKESDVQAIVDKAELEYEQRIKVQEASREVRRVMRIKEEGASITQRGFRKWKQASFRKISGR